MLDMYFSQHQVYVGSNQVILENVSHRDNFCPCKHIALQEELWIPLLHAAVVYLIQLNRIIPCELGESLKLFLFKKTSECYVYFLQRFPLNAFTARNKPQASNTK